MLTGRGLAVSGDPRVARGLRMVLRGEVSGDLRGGKGALERGLAGLAPPRR